MEPTMIIKTKSGNEYALLNREYLKDIIAAEPTKGAFSVDALAQIDNCGWIICYPEINEYFGIYEPVDDEYELDEVYDKLDEPVSESLHTYRHGKHINEAFEERFNRQNTINNIYSEMVKVMNHDWSSWSSQFPRYTPVNTYLNQLGTDWTYRMGDQNDAKMEAYKEKDSDPERLVKSIKSLDKLVYRSYWCEKHWPEAATVFKPAALDMIDAQFKEYLDKKEGEESARKQKYEDDFANTDTDEYKPKKRDWEKMVDYMNRKSEPNRVAQSCKDANKCVARYIIAKALGWEGAIYAFAYRVKELGILNQAQLDAYAEKYKTANIPDEYKELVDDLKSFDTKGGIATGGVRNIQAFGVKLEHAFDNNPTIESYKSVRHNTGWHTNMKDETLEVTTISGNVYKVCLDYDPSNRWGDKYTLAVRDMENNDYLKGYSANTLDLLTDFIENFDFDNIKK